jgi:hypothetical protein
MTPNGLRCVALRPEDSEATHQIDMAVWLAAADAAVLVAQRADRQGLAGLTAPVCTPTDVIQARWRSWKVGMLIEMCGGTASGPPWCARPRCGRGSADTGSPFPTRSLTPSICSAHEALGFIEVERTAISEKTAISKKTVTPCAQGGVTSADLARSAKPVSLLQQSAREIGPVSRWPVRAGSGEPPTHRAGTTEIARSRRAANRP